MDVVSIIALVASILAIIVSVCTIATFVGNKKKDGKAEGTTEGTMLADIRYMRNSFDDLRLDIKELNRKSDNQAERITRLEESNKQAHKRIDNLEKLCR